MIEVHLYMGRFSGKSKVGWSRSPGRGTSLTGKCTTLGPYCRPMPRVLGGSYGGGRFFMGEVPLYRSISYIQVISDSPTFFVHLFKVRI